MSKTGTSPRRILHPLDFFVNFPHKKPMPGLYAKKLRKSESTAAIPANTTRVIYDSDDLKRESIPDNKQLMLVGRMSGGTPDTPVSGTSTDYLPIELILRQYDEDGGEISETLVFPGDSYCSFRFQLHGFGSKAERGSATRWRVEAYNADSVETSSCNIAAQIVEGSGPDYWSYNGHLAMSAVDTNWRLIYTRIPDNYSASSINYRVRNNASVGSVNIRLGNYMPSLYGGPYFDENIVPGLTAAAGASTGSALGPNTDGLFVTARLRYTTTPTDPAATFHFHPVQAVT